MTDVNEVINRLKLAEEKLKDVAQGRAFTVGVQVIYKDQLGVVTDLNKGSQDPVGSTVDIRLHDGKVIEGVSVTSKQLQRFRG